MTLSNLFSEDYVSIARFKMSCKHSSVKIYFKYYLFDKTQIAYAPMLF